MPKTLLLADDSVVIQKLVGLSFANEDVEIVTTDNGDDAITMALDLKPDVVLADIVMPGKSGYEVCEAIKQNPALAHIPVLLLTGTFEAFDEAQATAAGADGHITKPFEAQALVERVMAVMTAAVGAAAKPAPAAIESSSTDDYDFLDADLTTLDSGASDRPLSAEPSATAPPAAIETDEGPLFGDPGDGAAEELNTESGGLAIGESVSPDEAPRLPSDEPTIAILPESPPPLPPSVGDPLTGFEDEFARAELAVDPPPVPPTAVNLEPEFGASRADAGATIVAPLDGGNPVPSSDSRIDETRGIEQEFEDLTVHTPSSAIDQDTASAPSPVAIENIPFSERPEDATVVANLDVSLADPVLDPTPSSAPPVDLGPSQASADDLDFGFDVSEQISVTELDDPLGDSFSSLMDISESQILAGPPGDSASPPDASAAKTIIDDAFGAGYDVSSSDLATAPTAAPTPDVPAFEPESDDSIAIGVPSDLGASQEESSRDPLAEATPPQSPPVEAALELGTPTPTSSGENRTVDLSPFMEQRIQETLEKVAWEAFSDLSETIVKQVISRVEKIAWEVIPQMAETLVREEIRKMKGEKD